MINVAQPTREKQVDSVQLGFICVTVKAKMKATSLLDGSIKNPI